MPTENETAFEKQNITDVKRSSSWLTGFFTGFSRGRNESSSQQAVSLSEQIAEAEAGDSRKLSVSEESQLKSFLKQNSTGEGSSHSDCESLSEDLDKVSSSPINVNTGGIRRNKTFPYLSQFTFHDNELAENDNLSELTSKSNYNASRSKDKMERSMSFDATSQAAGFSNHRRRLPSESSILGSLTGRGSRGALFPSDSVDRQNEETSEAFDTSEIVHFLSSGRSY